MENKKLSFSSKTNDTDSKTELYCITTFGLDGCSGLDFSFGTKTNPEVILTPLQ